MSKVPEISCGIVYFKLPVVLFSKMTTFKVKSIYVGFSLAICNFVQKKKKISRRCSNNHWGRRRLRLLSSLIGQRGCQSSSVTFAAPPTNAQRRRSFHNIPSTCGSSAAVGEERRERREHLLRHSGWGPEKDGERSATGGERGCGVSGEPAGEARTSGEGCVIVRVFFFLQSNFPTVPTCHRPAKTTAVSNTPITWDLTVWRRRWGKDRQVSWDGALAASPPCLIAPFIVEELRVHLKSGCRW